MDRRSAIRRLGVLAMGAAMASLPHLGRASQSVRSVVREAGGWCAVIGHRGEVLIRVSPRFALEHPRETLEILTTGTFR